MLRDCPHLQLQEQVMASIWQYFPEHVVLCACFIADRQKMSPGCYEIIFLASGILAIDGNLSVHARYLPGGLFMHMIRHPIPCYNILIAELRVLYILHWYSMSCQIFLWRHTCTTLSILLTRSQKPAGLCMYVNSSCSIAHASFCALLTTLRHAVLDPLTSAIGQRFGDNVSLCNGVLQAAGRLHQHHTNIDAGFGLGVTSEPAASAASTAAQQVLNSIQSPGPRTDQSVDYTLHLRGLAMVVWSTCMEAAAAGTALTEAGWQAVWDWQSTPGDPTQHLCLLYMTRCICCPLLQAPPHTYYWPRCNAGW